MRSRLLAIAFSILAIVGIGLVSGCKKESEDNKVNPAPKSSPKDPNAPPAPGGSTSGGASSESATPPNLGK